MRTLKFSSAAMVVSSLCFYGCSSGTPGSPTIDEDGGSSSSSGSGSSSSGSGSGGSSGSGSSGGSSGSGSSGSSSGGNGCPTFNYGSYTPASTTLTLSHDIAPIVQGNCAFGGCHATGGGAQAGFDLGPTTGTPTAAQLTAILTGMKANSMAAPNVKRVVPGMPEKSFLMVKLEGDPAACNSECTGGSLGTCGQRMPLGGMLPDPMVAKFRDWIKSGANP